jgi:hypothetical protein
VVLVDIRNGGKRTAADDVAESCLSDLWDIVVTNPNARDTVVVLVVVAIACC